MDNWRIKNLGKYTLSGKDNPNYGKEMPVEIKQKLSLSNKGQKSWNKGKKCPKQSEMLKEKYKNGWMPMKGKSNKWGKHSEESKRKIGEKSKGRMAGEKSNFWKGGKTIGQKERMLWKYKEWRKQIFERDDYTCLNCGKRDGKIQAHHIMPFADYPELRIDINNGITLCIKCHQKI